MGEGREKSYSDVREADEAVELPKVGLNGSFGQRRIGERRGRNPIERNSSIHFRDQNCAGDGQRASHAEPRHAHLLSKKMAGPELAHCDTDLRMRKKGSKDCN